MNRFRERLAGLGYLLFVAVAIAIYWCVERVVGRDDEDWE